MFLVSLRVMRGIAAESNLRSLRMREVAVVPFATTIYKSRFLQAADELSDFLWHDYIVLW